MSLKLSRSPEVLLSRVSDCCVVGNKFKNLLDDESNHSKWEEFRRIAKSETTNEECSQLLRRMELEDSDEEVEDLPEDVMDKDIVEVEADQFEKNHDRKKQKRQIQWGPVQRMSRPRRYPEDGKTVMQRAGELKEYKNLCKGTQIDRGEGADTLDHEVSEEMEIHVRPRVGFFGGVVNPEVGKQGTPTAKNLLGRGGAIKTGDVGFSVFEAGLNRCDSV